MCARVCANDAAPPPPPHPPRSCAPRGKLERIHISSMQPECVLGLPGMLCTISAARAKGHESADTPLHIYGPPGLAEYVE